MTSSILKSFLIILFVNSSVTQTKHCELCRARLRRDAEKIQVQKEVKKREFSKKIKMEKVFLKKAVKIGAVCLDGSPPGYHFRKGFGNGLNKWIMFFNGGAWCFDEQSCYQRSHSVYGSSRFDTVFSQDGLYSNDPQTNPDFYNWNMVFIIYCDGSSFTGMRQEPVYFYHKPVYFRGKAILEAIIQNLLSRGVRSASDVLLCGSSAGSLAVLIHADFVKSKLNPKTKVRAFADSGYFVDLKTQYGTYKTRDMFNRMLFTHNSTSNLHHACVKRMTKAEHWKCFFPQYFFHLIQTPVFVLQSAYDVWQIVNNLDIVCVIPSYKDLLLFTYLKRLRTSRKTIENPLMTSSRDTPSGTGNSSHETKKASREKSHASHVPSHASRGTNHVQKFNSIPLKNAHSWHTRIPHGKFLSEPIPRVSRNISAKSAQFRRKREPKRAQNIRAKSRNISAKRAQFKRKREPKRAQNIRAKSRNNVKEKKKSYKWHWQSLYSYPTPCTKDETEKILNLRKLTIEALKPVIAKSDSGLFLSSCFEHSQATYSKIWQQSRIKGKSPRDTMAEWYFGKPGNHIHIGPEFEFGSCMT